MLINLKRHLRHPTSGNHMKPLGLDIRRPFADNRMSQMSVNGLLTSGPNGLNVGSPSPRAHIAIKYRTSQMSGNGLPTSNPSWYNVGSPTSRAHLSPAHTNIGHRKCLVMGFCHQTDMGTMWAAQHHEPTYRPYKYRTSQMLVNGLETSGPSGLEVGSPSPRAH